MPLLADGAVCPAAAAALGAVGVDGLPALVEALRSPTESVVVPAAQGVARIGPPAAGAVPELVRLATDPKRAVARTTARAALTAVGRPGAVALAGELKNVDPDRRRYAGEALNACPELAWLVVPELEAAAAGGDGAVRTYAARAAFTAGSRAEGVVRTLTEVMKSPDPFARAAVAATLADAPSLPPELIAAARDALSDSSDRVRVYAAAALARANDPAAVPVLKAALGDPSYRQAAATALSNLPRPAPALKAAGPALRAVVTDLANRTNTNLTGHAALALARVGDPEAAAQVTMALTGATGPFRYDLAGAALRECGPAGVEALKKLVDHQNSRVRAAAVEQLGPVAATDPDALKAIIARLTDSDTPVRLRVAVALRWAGPRNTEACEAAARLLPDGYTYVRLEAAKTILHLGGMRGRAEALEVVREALQFPEGTTANDIPWLADAVGRIGTDAAPAVPDLIPLLRRADLLTQAKAAEALGRVGKPAREALPTLARLADAPDPRVRALAAVVR